MANDYTGLEKGEHTFIVSLTTVGTQVLFRLPAWIRETKIRAVVNDVRQVRQAPQDTAAIGSHYVTIEAAKEPVVDVWRHSAARPPDWPPVFSLVPTVNPTTVEITLKPW